jgi:flavin-dependent dehydrogenase
MKGQASATQTCDVLIIGGGPAGSTAATLLAQKGHQVVVMEKEKFPRFHIGESLLPVNNGLFEELGVLDQVDRVSMKKHAAQFDSMYHDKQQSFYFARAMNGRFPFSYEIHRADLDQILLDNCRAKGAQVYEETSVTGVDFSDQEFVHVTTQDKDGEKKWRARFIMDASGRDTFLANRFKCKKPYPNHASAALYGHYAGVQRLPAPDEGNITLFWFDHGWFWLIPLINGNTSVGMVCWPSFLKTRKTDITTFMQDAIATCPPLARRMRNARLTVPITATGNYSYVSKKMCGDRYLLLGDAYAFIDPIFSSGVLLAMKSAYAAAAAVDAGLRNPAHMARGLRRFEKSVHTGIKGFTWLIFRMTTPMLRQLVMNPRNVLGVETAVIAILAGDVHDNLRARLGMLVFKFLYYMGSLATLPASLRAYLKRRRMVRPESFDG